MKEIGIRFLIGISLFFCYAYIFWVIPPIGIIIGAICVIVCCFMLGVKICDLVKKKDEHPARKNSGSVQDKQPLVESRIIETVEPVQSIQPVQPFQTVQTTNPVKPIQTTQSTQMFHDVHPIDSTTSVQHVSEMPETEYRSVPSGTIRFQPSYMDINGIEDLHRRYSFQPTKFEEFVAEVYRCIGFEAEVTPPVNDGGKDIVMQKDGKTYVVEVKLYDPSNKIGRERIQKLHSALIDTNADYAIFVTTSDFSAPAVEYAEKYHIEMVNGDRLLELIGVANRMESARSEKYRMEMERHHEAKEQREKELRGESEPHSSAKREHVISSGRYYFGRNFPRGIYDLVVIEGHGSLKAYKKESSSWDTFYLGVDPGEDRDCAQSFYGLCDDTYDSFVIDGFTCRIFPAAMIQF